MSRIFMKPSTEKWRRVNRSRFTSDADFNKWQAERKRVYRATHRRRYLAELKRNRERQRKARLNVYPLLERVTHMTMETDEPVLELLTLSEVSRRLGVCGNTLRRAVEREGIAPDAVSIAGSKRKRSPLFVEPRLPLLAKLIEA
jgi:hypothetical protein